MLAKDLKEEIFNSQKPSNWRDGQFVFNYIDNKYKIARHIQFNKGIDCFYRDDQIDKFIEIAAELITKFKL